MDIEEFMNMQRNLQIDMKVVNPTQSGDPYRMDSEQLAQFITWNHTALIVELSEMLGEVGWKPWASSRHVDGAAALKEMVDAFHFFLNILLALGAWDGAEVEEVAHFFTQGYEEKNAKNLQRQVDNYDGVSTKCPNCKRELSEVAESSLVQVSGVTFCSRTCFVELDHA